MMAAPSLNPQTSHQSAKEEFDAVIISEFDLPILPHSVIQNSVIILKTLLLDCDDDPNLNDRIRSEIDLYEYFITNSFCFLL
jgi:hypothetical protein